MIGGNLNKFEIPNQVLQLIQLFGLTILIILNQFSKLFLFTECDQQNPSKDYKNTKYFKKIEKQ